MDYLSVARLLVPSDKLGEIISRRVCRKRFDLFMASVKVGKEGRGGEYRISRWLSKGTPLLRAGMDFYGTKRLRLVDFMGQKD